MSHDASDTFSVLIIDDNKVLLNDYKAFFTDAGFSVYSAENATRGIAVAEEKQPSVILLDLMMPDINGIDALTDLKDNDKTKHIPVVVITALVNELEKDASLKAGAEEYVEKVEIEPVDLVKKVKQIAQHQRKQATVS